MITLSKDKTVPIKVPLEMLNLFERRVEKRCEELSIRKIESFIVVDKTNV